MDFRRFGAVCVVLSLAHEGCSGGALGTTSPDGDDPAVLRACATQSTVSASEVPPRHRAFASACDPTPADANSIFIYGASGVPCTSDAQCRGLHHRQMFDGRRLRRWCVRLLHAFCSQRNRRKYELLREWKLPGRRRLRRRRLLRTEWWALQLGRRLLLPHRGRHMCRPGDRLPILLLQHLRILSRPGRVRVPGVLRRRLLAGGPAQSRQLGAARRSFHPVTASC